MNAITIKSGVFLFQFNVEKTAEPVQPRTILGFPHIYGPKPVVTTSEIVNYVDYNLKTVEEPSKGKPEALDKKRMTIQVNEELFLLPQNGGAFVKLLIIASALNEES